MSASLQSMAESLRNALFGARQSQESLRAKLAELRSERRRIATALLDRADTEAALLQMIQRQCDVSQDAMLLREISDARQLAPHVADGLPIHDALIIPELGNAANQTLINRLMSVLATPEMILERLKPALDSLDWDASGKPMGRRKQRLAALDKEIAAVETELAGLESAIASTQDVAPADEPHLGDIRVINGQRAQWRRIGTDAPAWHWVGAEDATQ